MQDVHLDEGRLAIRNAKDNKERIVPMHESLTEICRTYIDVSRKDSSPDDFFFAARKGRDNGHLCIEWAKKQIHKALVLTSVDTMKNPINGRSVCLHNLRHTFAVRSLAKQHEDGVDRYYAVPILSTYLGHNDIYGTEKYLQLTEECYSVIVGQMNEYSSSIFPEVLP
jgi:integrase